MSVKQIMEDVINLQIAQILMEVLIAVLAPMVIMVLV